MNDVEKATQRFREKFFSSKFTMKPSQSAAQNSPGSKERRDTKAVTDLLETETKAVKNFLKTETFEYIRKMK
jgi:hypothetical protein